MVANDPIHQWQGKWWFWDEIWADRIGPYETEEIARQQCDKYCEHLNSGCGACGNPDTDDNIYLHPERKVATKLCPMCADHAELNGYQIVEAKNGTDRTET